MTLRPWPVDLARQLVAGHPLPTAEVAHWHPEYPAVDTVDGLALVLAAHEAMGTLDGLPRWWNHQIWLADEVVGDAGFHGPPPSSGPQVVEVGYVVVPGRRGHGVAGAACRLLLERAWADGADQVLAETDEANLASRRVLAGNGFRRRLSGDWAVDRPPAVGR